MRPRIARKWPVFTLFVAPLVFVGCTDDPGAELEFTEFRAGLGDGLLLHYTFEDRVGTQILDVSGNNRHGWAQGGSFVGSPSGEALSLDGIDDYVAFAGPRAPSLYGGVDGDVTISARVRVADVGKYNSLCFGCGPVNSMYVGTPSHGPRAVAAIFDQGTDGLVWPWTSQALTDDAWVEVTMIVEGGVGTRFYLDCALDSEIPDPDVGLEDYGSSNLGASASANNWYGGEIDEFRIWNRALSEDELPAVCGQPALGVGLELHWTFEDHDGDSILDMSGNGRHGALIGGGSFVSSPNGESVSLDGVDDRIGFVGPRDPALYGGPQGDFTISSRLKVTDADKGNTFCFGCGPFNAMFVGNPPAGNQVMAKVWDGGTGFLVPKTSLALADDTWVEVTMIVEGGVGARLYLDGSLNSELLNPAIGLRDYNYSAIGQGASPSWWYQGEIDELRIWNRALSAEEVALLGPALPPLELGLVLRWTFEDHTDNQIHDVSGNGYGAANHGGTFVDSPNGQALSLDGVDDYIAVLGPRSPAIYGGEDGTFTLSARVRVSDVTKLNTLSFGFGPFNAMYIGNVLGGNRAAAKLHDQSTAGFLWATSSSSLQSDTWVEVTMTVDGTTGARVYLDCALDSELDEPDVGLKDYNYTAVGQGFNVDTWFGGELDELRVWDRVLSDDELAALCQ